MVGCHGAGRFALFGGPHLFESSTLGLLALADNPRFLRNLLDWLLRDEAGHQPMAKHAAAPLLDPGVMWFSQVEGHGDGERTIASVERILRKTGVLKALSRAKWMP